MGDVVLKTNGLFMSYGHQLVLDDLSMTINKGDIYGFVGENGSGKTTVIRLVCGLIFPDGGDYELFGVNNNDPEILKVRKKVGGIVESPSIYPNMTARDNLAMQSIILGIKDEGRIKAVLETVGLKDLYESKKVAGNFSLGMRQRLGIAMALMSKADFLILDEPLNGLDPEGIVEIRNLILKLNQEYGITFLISSHILSELSLVATKYGIISHGHILTEVTAEEISMQCEKRIEIDTNDKEALKEALSTLVAPHLIKDTKKGVAIPGDVDYSQVLNAISGLSIQGINTISTTVEDYYLSLIKGGRENA